MRNTARWILILGLVLGTGFLSVPAALAQSAQPQPQIKITQIDNSQFPQVTVYVSVTNAAGEPVGVDPSTIQISESGKAMQPTSVKGFRCGCKAARRELWYVYMQKISCTRG